MYCMKAYIVAEQKELGIRLANMINRSGSMCIISDASATDYRTLLSDIKGSIASFDLAILVSKAPIEACIEANRMGGIRATVCKDVEDTKAAIKARANLIVFDSAKIYKMDTRAMLKSIQDSFEEPESGAAPQERKAMSQAPASKPMPVKTPGGGGFFGSIKSVFGADESALEERGQKMEPPKKKPVEKKPQKLEEEMPPSKKKGKGGIFDSLKDTFGVE